VSKLGRIATAQSSKSSDWAVDNALTFDSSVKAIRRARSLNGKYFILGGDPNKQFNESTLWYSSEGNTWARGSIPGTNAPEELWDIAFGNGKYILSGSSSVGSTSSGLMESDDGITWRNITAENLRGVLWKSIAFGNGRFVAVENTNGKTATSTDGVNWTVTVIAEDRPGAGLGLQSVVFIPGRNLFIVGANARTNANNSDVLGTIYTSSDGLTWARADTGVPLNILQMACDNSICVATTNDTPAKSRKPLVISSSDLVTWATYEYTSAVRDPSKEPRPEFLSDIVKTSSGWLVGGTPGLLLTSPNGSAWTKVLPR
jgi:hypothetical protein